MRPSRTNPTKAKRDKKESDDRLAIAARVLAGLITTARLDPFHQGTAESLVVNSVRYANMLMDALKDSDK